MNDLLARARGKLLRELGHFFDSYSLYLNLPPQGSRMHRFAECARVGRDSLVAGRIELPSPGFVELASNVRLGSLSAGRGRYLFVDQNVAEQGELRCDTHCIRTREREYAGGELEGNVVTVSVDFEGGVALSHASPETWHHLRRFWDSRECVKKLAALFRKYRIPVTWAVCGHLFLRSCSGNHGFKESDWLGDWFLHDPCSDLKADPSWYMPEVIEDLLGTPQFEIGYHTFGHFRYRYCTEETVRLDMELADRIRKEWGLKLESFVFPYNECGHFDLLKEGGFTNIRGNIGRVLPAYGTIDFGEFRFFNTTQMFAPETMQRCRGLLEGLGDRSANFYTHCYQWGERDAWTELETWLAKLAAMRDRGAIRLATMRDAHRPPAASIGGAVKETGEREEAA